MTRDNLIQKIWRKTVKTDNNQNNGGGCTEVSILPMIIGSYFNLLNTVLLKLVAIEEELVDYGENVITAGVQLQLFSYLLLFLASSLASKESSSSWSSIESLRGAGSSVILYCKCV